MKADRFFFYALSFGLLITALRIFSLYHSSIPLWVDEAQYWGWSTEPALGYYSKPPFIAWLIAYTTDIFGSNEFGIRAGAPVIHFFASIFIFLIGRDLYSSKTGFIAAVAYITLPAVSISSSFISADAPLMLFWAGSLFLLLRLTSSTKPTKYLFASWLFYAVFVGLGLLSKYTMAAFVLMSFYHMFKSEKLHPLKYPAFWIANALAFLIFVPNLLWNYNNGFASFIHTGENVVAGKAGGGIKIGGLFEFIGGQIVVFGAALVYFVIAFKNNRSEKNDRKLLLFSLPLIITGLVVSLLSGAQAHWAAPAYIALIIYVVHHLHKAGSTKWLKIILISNLIVTIICFDIRLPATIASVSKDPLERVKMWYRLQQPLQQIMTENPEAFLVSDERKIIAPLMFALKDSNGKPATIYKWNPGNNVRDHYDLTRSFADVSESPVIFITRSDAGSTLADIFFYVDVLKRPEEGSPFHIYLLKGRR